MIEKTGGIPIILKYEAMEFCGVEYKEFEIQATLYPDGLVKIEWDQQKKCGHLLHSVYGLMCLIKLIPVLKWLEFMRQ
jgi:hypothetical protein